MTIQSIETVQELDGILAQGTNKVIVLKFHANWCPPCRTLGPKVEAISSDYPTLIFLSADMEQIIPKLKLRFEVSSLPNTLFLKPDDGVILDQVLGADIDRIKKLCDRWGAGFLGVGGGEQALKSGNCNGGSCAVGGEKGMDEATQFVVRSTISNIEFLEKEGKLDTWQAKIMKSDLRKILDSKQAGSAASSTFKSHSPTPSRSIPARPASIASATTSTVPNSTPAARKKVPLPPTAAIPSPPIPKKIESKDKVIALWDYTASASDEISFKEGDVISILERTSADWWKGQKITTTGGNATGLLPSAYVEDLEVARQVVSGNNDTSRGRSLPPAYSGEDRVNNPETKTWKAPVARFSSNGDVGGNVREGAPTPNTEEQKAKHDRLKKLGGHVGTSAAGGFGAGIGFGIARSVF